MRAHSLLTLLIGLPLAGAALFLLDQRLSEREAARLAPAVPVATMVTVVVAARDLAPGDLLRADALRELAWPAGSVPRGAFASIEELLAGGEEPRARHAILSGEPVLATKVTGFRSGSAPGKNEVAPAKPQRLARAGQTGNLGGGYP